MESRDAIRKASASVWLIAAASLLLSMPFGSRCAAQAAAKPPATQRAPATQDAKTASPPHRTRRRPKLTGPASLSNKAATPPQVTLDHGKLTVDAQNSDLSAILQDVSQKSGMSVDGLSRNTRVFGVYGPGSPRDVLSALLTGAGYNFVMAGGESGSVPRELVLTAQTGNALPANPVRPAQPQPAASEDEEPGAEENGRQPLGPGAIAHPSPQDTDQTDPQTRMQRHLDTLRHMQQTIQQQQQQQSQQKPPNQPQ